MVGFVRLEVPGLLLVSCVVYSYISVWLMVTASIVSFKCPRRGRSCIERMCIFSWGLPLQNGGGGALRLGGLSRRSFGVSGRRSSGFELK